MRSIISLCPPSATFEEIYIIFTDFRIYDCFSAFSSFSNEKERISPN
jgi:hypothetical protein